MFEIYAGYDLTRDPSVSVQGATEEALGGRPLRRANLIWQEHCSECAMPHCYSSCDYFRPRADYKCRRFDGGVALAEPTALTLAPIRMRFGKWARLLAYGPRPLASVAEVLAEERRVLKRASWLDRIPASRGLLAPVRRRMTNNLAATSGDGWSNPADLVFVLETFVEGEPAELLLNARIVDEHDLSLGETFRTKVTAEPGHRVFRVPVNDLLGPLTADQRFCIELAPANDGDRPEVVFGLMDIVEMEATEPPPATGSTGPLKCVVWDLDNTLWEGTLIEDGLEQLRLRPGIAETIRELDRRGVLHSIASKNNEDEALAAVESFGLSEYFLAPQVSWGPKSQGIRAIASRLNIGIDSLAFIDDQPFEQAEVRSVHPQVLVLSPEEIQGLEDHPRLGREVTEESRARRSMYQAELQREQALTTGTDDYDEFLRSCRIRVDIAALSEADIARAFELAQRTNQLNLSTTRYSRAQIDEFAAPEAPVEAFTVRAEDRFGTYGLVGFCVFDPGTATILDLMFSCRIQSKLVDDAFLAWLAEARVGRGRGPLRARFRPSARNSPARELLERAGFGRESTEDEQEIWVRQDAERTLAELTDILEVTAPDAT